MKRYILKNLGKEGARKADSFLTIGGMILSILFGILGGALLSLLLLILLK